MDNNPFHIRENSAPPDGKPSHSGRSEALAVCNISNIWHVHFGQSPNHPEDWGMYSVICSTTSPPDIPTTFHSHCLVGKVKSDTTCFTFATTFGTRAPFPSFLIVRSDPTKTFRARDTAARAGAASIRGPMLQGHTTLVREVVVPWMRNEKNWQKR
jgi:hypothetical protein